mmetsp:Transcript_24974/g.37518  ORF Transcript_24974/g.37518 Transcript_24974/m.37518 type:complete len:114 (-) Transcript_24974:219-560(-)
MATNLRVSPVSCSISFTTGSTILQGPHQAAEMNSTTGLGESYTSSSKLLSVSSLNKLFAPKRDDVLFPAVDVAAHVEGLGNVKPQLLKLSTPEKETSKVTQIKIFFREASIVI